ncbi:MAG TPA: PIG-L family deacetylase [Phycisphaerae bacterium]|nr:PIG-L family deacetylase [Phycisphaerae bacterium]
MSEIAFAVAAHPDDIEFMMGGTLLLLGLAGCELHYMTVANGSCGSVTADARRTAALRTEEARAAAKVLGAVYHPPLTDDIQIYYTPSLVAKLCAIVRQVNPRVLLVPSPQDYMEDHVNTARLAVTAAFCRNMPNFPTDPPTEPVDGDVAVYHAQPYGLRDPLRNVVRPDLFVDVSSVLDRKRRALACHRSQKEWLDVSQGTGSYLKAMDDLSAEMGRMSGRSEHAEGWRRHLHLGFAGEDFDPVTDALGELVMKAGPT